MPRKSVVKSRCALCGAKEVSEPRGEEKYREIRDRFELHLLRVKEAVEALHAEIYG